MTKLKKDKYTSAGGGYSRILNISCEHCNTHICFYQKNGPGVLKRTYLDRIEGCSTADENLMCPECIRLLGVSMIYDKEQRPAYRLFVGSVTKKIVNSASAQS